MVMPWLRLRGSGEDVLHHIPMHIRESEIPSLKAVRQPLVIDAQPVQYRCIEVMNVDRVLGDVVAVVVCFAVDEARLYAAAGHPEGEAPAVVVAAVIVVAEG